MKRSSRVIAWNKGISMLYSDCLLMRWPRKANDIVFSEVIGISKVNKYRILARQKNKNFQSFVQLNELFLLYQSKWKRTLLYLYKSWQWDHIFSWVSIQIQVLKAFIQKPRNSQSNRKFFDSIEFMVWNSGHLNVGLF